MAIVKRIASLEVKELVGLCIVFLKQPFYLLPTYKATNRTVAICNRLYKKLHHEDNRTNAFRHALWNFLICQYCLPAAKSPEAAMSWSEKITDLHEVLSPNDKLAKLMDLHNNRIGRELFYNSLTSNLEIVTVLQQKTREAVKVESQAEIEKAANNLVFIENLKMPL